MKEKYIKNNECVVCGNGTFYREVNFSMPLKYNEKEKSFDFHKEELLDIITNGDIFYYFNGVLGRVKCSNCGTEYNNDGKIVDFL